MVGKFKSCFAMSQIIEQEIEVDLGQLCTLGRVASYHGAARPESIALRFEGRDTTYSEFEDHTNQVANALVSGGVIKGGRIAYIGKNTDHFFELFFGAAKAGVVTIPIGWRLTPPEIAYIIGDGDVSLVFVGREVVEVVREALSLAKRSTRIIEVEDFEGRGFVAWRDAQLKTTPRIITKESDVVVQLYTSGTTGRPKGVMLTHESLLTIRRHSIESEQHWEVWGPTDTSLVAMPVSHVSGLAWGMTGLLVGGKNIVTREFDPCDILDFVIRDRISKIFLVPTALQIILSQPNARQVDYSCLRSITYGASPIPITLLRACIEVFGSGFCQVYGMTETSGAITYLREEDHDILGNERMRSVGLPLPGVEIRVVDSDGVILPPRSIGEIETRSAGNMAGYWSLDEATQSVLSEDGWLRTGDAGYLDEDGYLFLQDRIKDIVISGGENIYPAEVEGAILDHPDVAEVAVIGVPDYKWGEAVKAIIVLKPGVTADAASIKDFVRRRVAGYKVPKSVEFVSSLPLNSTGKVLKWKLRELYVTAKSGALSI